MKKRSMIILFLLLFLSIGFAILSSNLNLNSNIAIAEAKFDVHFEDVNVEKTNVSNYSNPVLNADKNEITMETDLDKPGDYITISFLVVNAGTIDAQLNEIIKTEFNAEEAKYLNQSYTYLNGTIPKNGDLLRVGSKKRIELTYVYKYDVENFISIGEKTMSFSMKYIQPNSYNENVWTYDFTNTYQTFTVPKNGNYKIELWGSQGGSGNNTAFGAYTSGIIELNKNDNLYVYVGATGKKFNYGLQGYIQNGGGSTDVRLVGGDWKSFDSLKSRIMVAAGSGSSGGLNSWDGGKPYSGAAGGLVGYKGGNLLRSNRTLIEGGLGATQTTGGNFGYSEVYYSNDPTVVKPSGGNGYFSGAYNGSTRGSGVEGHGGGSSYISGHNGCVAIDESSTEDNITFVNDSNGVACNDSSSTGYNVAGYNTDVACSRHYSGKVFTNTVMIDGKGYKWTTEKGTTVVGMPTFDGTGTMTGNSGNGYAKITYLG